MTGRVDTTTRAAIEEAAAGYLDVCASTGRHHFVQDATGGWVPVCVECGADCEDEDPLVTPLTWDGLPLDDAATLDAYEAGS